ncbi:MAG: hypothetical protein IJ168_06540 [Eubacterium sp.]|nr:hypothetical protein [Eubacterium sp.]
MSDLSNRSSDDRRRREAVCIDTSRIYDACSSRDCAENLRVTFDENSQDIIDDAEIIKCRDCDIAAVSIDLDETPFNRGYFNVDISFYFKLRFDTYTSPMAMPRTVKGYAVFNKRCILYGSEGSVKTFTSTLNTCGSDRPEAPQYTNPTVKVQALDPVVLDTDVVRRCNCHICCCTSFPDSIRNAVGGARFTDDGEKAVLVTLGIFSIIQMTRDVQIMIPSYDFCVPDRECDCSDQSPCSAFGNIDFPTDEFFPPDRDNLNCSCRDRD